MDNKYTFFIITISITFLLSSCAPNKSDVSDSDIKRLIERVSVIRFTQSLDQEEGSKLKTDHEIFLEACKVFRLDPIKTKEKLKITNPKLYERLVEKNEE